MATKYSNSRWLGSFTWAWPISFLGIIIIKLSYRISTQQQTVWILLLTGTKTMTNKRTNTKYGRTNETCYVIMFEILKVIEKVFWSNKVWKVFTMLQEYSILETIWIHLKFRFFIFHYKGVSSFGNSKGNMTLLIAVNCWSNTIYVLIMNKFHHVIVSSG